MEGSLTGNDAATESLIAERSVLGFSIFFYYKFDASLSSILYRRCRQSPTKSSCNTQIPCDHSVSDWLHCASPSSSESVDFFSFYSNNFPRDSEIVSTLAVPCNCERMLLDCDGEVSYRARQYG